MLATLLVEYCILLLELVNAQLYLHVDCSRVEFVYIFNQNNLKL